jgi:serine/threonine-protein kinase
MGDTLSAGATATFGPFRLDMTNRMLSRDGVDVALPPRAVAVLWLLVARAGHVVSKQDLLDTVWKDAYVSDTSLAEAVSLVRHTLGDDAQQPAFIQTLPRRGYRFVAPVTLDDPGAPALPVRDQLAPSDVTPALSDAAPLWTPWLPYLACFALGVAVGLAALALSRVPPAAPRSVVQLGLGLPEGVTIDPSPRPLAVTRGGDVAAIVVRWRDGTRHLTIRRLDRPELMTIRDSEGAAAPFFSPDGRWVAFFARGRLHKAMVAGGISEPIADAPAALGATWNEDDTIVFASRWTGGLAIVPAAGGPVHDLTTPDIGRGEVRHAWPTAIEGGHGDISFVAAYALDAATDGRVAFVNTRTRSIKRLDLSATDVRPLPTGHLLLLQPGRAAAAPIDLPSASLTGSLVTLPDPVDVDPLSGGAAVAISSAGLRLALGSDSSPVEWLDSSGGRHTISAGLIDLDDLALSPDSTRVAGIERRRDSQQLWIVDVARGARTLLTRARRLASPVWSPDGREVAYAAGERSGLALSIVQADGSASPRQVLSERGALVPTGWSPDGREVIAARSSQSGWDLVRLAAAGGSVAALTASSEDEAGGVVSPDGKWLAYQTNQSGNWALAVRAFQASSPVMLVAASGYRPAWLDSSTLVFDNGAQLLRVTIPADSHRPPNPAVLVADRMTMAGRGAGADGRVLVRAISTTPSATIEWYDKLRATIAASQPLPGVIR